MLDDVEHRAQAREKSQRLASAPAIDTAGLRLADACALLLDEAIEDREVRREILDRVGRQPLARAVEQIRELARPAEEGHREQMLSGYNTVRRFLPLLLDTLDFHATDAGEPALRALAALETVLHRRKPTSSDVPVELISRAWRRLAEPEPGRIDRRAYTFGALEQLREGLHRRDVFITRSDRWGDPRTILLDDRSWRVSKAESCRSLGLPQDANDFVGQLAGEVDAAYARSQEGLRRDHPVFAVADGRLDLAKLDALPEPDSLVWLRDRQHATLSDAELPDLLLEIAARTGFVTGSPTSESQTLSSQTCTSDLRRSDRPGVQRRLAAGRQREHPGAARGPAQVGRSSLHPSRDADRRQRPGSSTTTPSCRSPSAGAAGRSPRSMGCGSWCPTARSTPGSIAATFTAAGA